jgi:acetaldehyde dehydrogenase (acetylating)
VNKLNVAILGSGNIGTDLLIKVLRSPYLACTMFAGRFSDSPGIRRARELGVPTSTQKINAILENPEICDLVFDATSAEAHLEHWPLLQKLGKIVIDLTPAHVGKMTLPPVRLEDSLQEQNVNLISCGGQASTPLAHAISKACEAIEYLEVVSSIASNSAGPATRINLDEYIENTERGLKYFSGAAKTKAILILNPAKPEINMQTTLYARVSAPNKARIEEEISKMVVRLQKYVPGYQLLVPPIVNGDQVTVSVKVIGLGDYLPSYAGNLDIINCAAIRVAESFAQKSAKGELCNA